MWILAESNKKAIRAKHKATGQGFDFSRTMGKKNQIPPKLWKPAVKYGLRLRVTICVIETNLYIFCHVHPPAKQAIRNFGPRCGRTVVFGIDDFCLIFVANSLRNRFAAF